ncbi:hypothetical protein ACFO5O_05595 [Geojedonia litorea]|uniref:YD repeat-containing protein n=1 Tax=Geojedonia litorea TaxID=1268269 RepID=A0ABV9N0P0_9FLAO
MRTIIKISIFLISGLCLSQNNWKVQAELKSNNNVKETNVFLIKKNKEKKLFAWYLYDKQGRELEQKSYSENGETTSHYKFEYPNDSLRYFISIDLNGNEIKKSSQKYSITAKTLESKTRNENNPILKEYDSNGNMVKVWKNVNGEKILLSAFTYDKNNLLIKEVLYQEKDGKSILNTKRIWKRDKNGLVQKIISKRKGEDDFITIYEYIKYST